ncbi:hypothetical protein [Solirhodobacter olei]|uniref:hypothetical protein n=1 Tax=Solirhodobacter olei TaxID=2493082 RepID=UPI000FD993E8|nr:hypothetical protein [Solirhodobacter olei]
MSSQTEMEDAGPEEAEGPATAAEQRVQVARGNRNLALILIGGALAMLAAAFAVALLVVYGG